MEALRRSVGDAAAESSVSKKPAKKAKKATGQKEMLMPIEEKKPAKKSSARRQRKSA